jgi:site-specific recombinase XerD
MFFDDSEQMRCSLQQYILTGEEFERLLEARTSSKEDRELIERITVRNQAILWVLYDTGVHSLELIHLHLQNFDREHDLITIQRPGAIQRRIALGNNCLYHLLSYVDHHRRSETEFANKSTLDEHHLFLSERTAFDYV